MEEGKKEKEITYQDIVDSVVDKVTNVDENVDENVEAANTDENVESVEAINTDEKIEDAKNVERKETWEGIVSGEGKVDIDKYIKKLEREGELRVGNGELLIITLSCVFILAPKSYSCNNDNFVVVLNKNTNDIYFFPQKLLIATKEDNKYSVYTLKYNGISFSHNDEIFVVFKKGE